MNLFIKQLHITQYNLFNKMCDHKLFWSIFAINLSMAIIISSIAYVILAELLLNKVIRANELYDTKTTYGVLTQYTNGLATWSYYVDDETYFCTWFAPYPNECWTTITYNVNDNTCVEQYGYATHNVRKSSNEWFTLAAIIYCCSIFGVIVLLTYMYYQISIYKRRVYIAQEQNAAEQEQININLDDLLA